MSAICGGIVKESEFEKNPEAYMMCFILPDKWYEKYVELLKEGKRKEASKIFRKHAWRHTGEDSLQ